MADVTPVKAALDAYTNQVAGEIVALQKQIETMQQGMPVWTPATRLVSGGFYRMPEQPTEVGVLVTVPDVTFVGGRVYSSGASPAFNVKARNTTIMGVKFDIPHAPPASQNWQKLGTRACVQTDAGNTQVIGCKGDKVDTFVLAYQNSNGTLVKHCETTLELRSSFFYSAGGRNAVILNNLTVDSQTENLVRFSPEQGQGPVGAIIAHNILRNIGNKAAIEMRTLDDAIVYMNFCEVSFEHSCISAGRKDFDGGVGSRRIRILENICNVGKIEIDNQAQDITIEGNKFYGHDNRVAAIHANGALGVAKNIRLRNNVSYLPAGVTTTKPFFRVVSPEKIEGLDVDASNRWENLV